MILYGDIWQDCTIADPPEEKFYIYQEFVNNIFIDIIKNKFNKFSGNRIYREDKYIERE